MFAMGVPLRPSAQFYNIEGKIIAAAAQEAVARRPKSSSKNPNVPAKNKL